MADGMTFDSRYKWLDCDGPAFGAPGLEPRWTSSAKDAVGTAYAASSKIWFTVSHGILNEIYYPTIDRPQIRDMQFLITDGETFFHEERRDLLHEFEYIDSDALAVRVRNRDREGRYCIIREIIADPHYPGGAGARASSTATSSCSPGCRSTRCWRRTWKAAAWATPRALLDIAGKRVAIAWKEGMSLAMAAAADSAAPVAATWAPATAGRT